MRSLYFLLVVLFLQLSTGVAFSQVQTLSLDMPSATVEEVLDEIASKSGYSFLYNSTLIDVDRQVSVVVHSKDIEAILGVLFDEVHVDYKIIDKQIVLTPKVVSSVPEESHKHIEGRVTDPKGEAVAGANVKVKGIALGTVTDVEGHFELDVPRNSLLEVSFIGYRTQELNTAGNALFAIVLQENTEVLDEVIVIGYGVMKKSDLTGSVGSVKAKDIQKMPVASVDQALQGRISGMQITSVNGAPGGETTVRIRGGNSIHAGNEPLYVIDGIIGGGDLSTINPSDIASIEVLKDASSTAIYGSRGANGVVLITTKRGEESDGPQVAYNGYYGFQTISKKLDLLNGREAAEFQNDYAAYYDRPLPFEEVASVVDTDWQRYIYQDVAPITDHNFNLSNASDKGNYFLSLNYFNQDGLMYNTGFERYQLRFNLDQHIGKYFTVGAAMTMAYTHRDNPSLTGVGILPTSPVYKEDGSYFNVNQISGGVFNNPVAQRDGILNETKTFRGLGSIYGQLTLWDHLVLKSSLGFDISHSKNNRYESVHLPTRVFNKTGGYAAVGTRFPITYQNENTLNYLLDLGAHSWAFLGGFTWQKYQFELVDTSASGLENDVNSFHAIETGDPLTRDIQTGEEKWGLLSYLFRINYSYKDRYLVTVSGRQDGSSRLSKENLWAFFPSVALAWRASDEEFIKKLDLFSNLKFRLSYGSSGSQSISPYSTKDRLDSGSTVIGNREVITFLPGLSANKNLGWEKTRQVDLGLEVGLWKNRLNVELDYYHKRTNHLLLAKELPFQTGFVSILENIGSIENQGVEMALRSVNIDKPDFQWSSTVSVSMNRNKVLDLGGKDFIENGRGSRLIVGEPLGSFWGVKYLGTWKADELTPDSKHQPGDPKLEDLNGDHIIDMNDGQIIGNAEPKFYGGIGNDLTYKRFSLSLFVDFSYGNDIYDLAGRALETGFNLNAYGHNRNRWSEANPNGYYPKAGSAFKYLYDTYAGGELNGGCSLYVHDGSFLRLKHINLQYDIPIKVRFIKSLQVYGTVSNVFTWTPYMGYSPDVNAEGTSTTRRGFDNNVYPQNRTFLLGIKANF